MAMTARLQNGYYQGEIDGAFLFYFAAVLLFSDVMTFVLIVWNEKDERLKGENLTLTARARTQAESIEALSASYTAQRKLTHDFNAHLATLSSYLDNGQIKDAQDYMATLQEQQTDRILIANTRNSTIDALLNQKAQVAKKNNIDIRFKVNDLSGIQVAPIDLVIIIGNLLDNAIEACVKLPAGEREIYAQLLLEDTLFLSFRNTWSAQSIQRILQNEKYCGDVLLQKTFTEDVLTGVHKKNTGQLPQYYIENYHEGIVSKQMFREVQAEIARRNSKSAANQRKRRRGRYNSKYALSERLFCGDCGSPYKRVTWNIHGRKQIVWRCVNRIEYGTKFCGSSPSIPEEELHRAILKAVQDLAANFTDEVAAQINGILHDIQTGESAKPNLQEQLEQTQQEFDRLLEMSLDFDEDTPFLDDRLKKLNSKIKSLKKGIEDSAARQEKIGQPEMLLSAKDMQIQEYDDTLTARIIEKITVRSRNEIEIRFIGGYKKTMQLI